MRRIVLAALLAITTPQVIQADDAPAATNLEMLGWLTGEWIDERGESSSEHVWTVVRGGTLLGMQRDIAPDSGTWVEFVKIHETPAGIVFTVIPTGQAQTDFTLVSATDTRAVFENPAHDFPRRIIYWLENGDILAARIEGTVDGRPRSSEWRWQRGDL